MDTDIENYLEFLRYCLAPEERAVPQCVSDIDWMKLKDFASQQAITGVYWYGIQKMGGLKDLPNGSLYMLKWMAKVVPEQRRSEQVSTVAVKVSRQFEAAGFDTCLLKGQGNALLYPDPLMRAPGDVDLYVRSHGWHGDTDADIRKILAYCRKTHPEGKAIYHHTQYGKIDDVEIEVHYRPSWLCSPIYNKRLQQFFLDHADEVFANEAELSAGKIQVPTWVFNLVYQLAHINSHLYEEGIGLRQLIDYYYLLRRSEGQKVRLDVDLSQLGLRKIAGAVMWVLVNVLGLEAELAIVEPDERRGRFLLHEILAGGNMGKHDDRTLSGVYASPIKANIQRLWRDLRLLRYFPSESLSEPFFRVYHWIWRKKH